MKWKYLSSSVTGKSHTTRNEKGQDYCRAGIFRLPDADIFIGLVADGAGSTCCGGAGAKITCDTLCRCIADTIEQQRDIGSLTSKDVIRWIECVRELIRTEAVENGKQVRDYACTLIGAIIGNHAFFFQIGDGAIVIAYDDADYETVFWPQQGEYSNTTYFISDDTFQNALMVASREIPPGKIAIFSDGLQNLALSYPEKAVHTGFFRPMFDFLVRISDNECTSLSSQLTNFLNCDEINERNDDDKTLILALSSPT